MKSKILLVAVFVVAALISLDCSHPTQSTGNGSGTGNAINAMLYNPGGSPAVHAKVRFYPINYNPRTHNLTKTIAAVVDSTTTDANGNYAAKLDTGTYNVLASGDSGVVYQDSITVVKDSTVHPPADTLKAPGSVRGVVRLQPGDDARTVFIIFMGTNILNMPDDSIGNFTAANIAQGTYKVRILTTLDAYLPKDTVLRVTAGKVDSLTHDIVLQYTGIPVPSGLTINYDTLKQIVTLAWNKPTTGRKVAGYNIYRSNIDSNTTLATINLHLVTDTVFSDSTGVQDLTYEYRIAAVDTNNSEGTKSAGVSVKVLSGYRLVREIGSQGTGDGQFSWITGIAVDSSGNIYATDDISTYPGSVRIQKFNNNGTFIIKWGGSTGSGVGQFNGVWELALYKDSLLYITDPGNSRIQVYDLQGNFQFQFKIGPMVSPYPDPHSIAILDSFVYVTEFMKSKVHKYTIAGDSLTEWNFPEYYTYLPSAIITAIPSGGNIYLKELSDTIYVYNANGTMIRDFHLPAGMITSYGIGAGNGNRIFVPDVDHNLVWEIDNNGNLIGRWAVQQPGKIAVDYHGKIYVSSQDTKIQVFQR
jgi:hypothetical protein